MSAAVARLQALQRLRDSIFKVDRAQAGLRTGRDILAAAPLRQKLLNHYPPNIDHLALSLQDKRLASLGLKDVWVEAQKVREQGLEARGKFVRVSVVDGPRKREELPTKAKGKKKR
ncbi:hypothetical protein BC831DRAFT_455940 [Entophlyctis helioformis]|nr:hypothetical protein BC831DRAFT_455940 [Entophlyctis helioformis]